RQAGRRRRPLPRLLGARGVAGVAIPGRVGSDRVSRGPDPVGAVRAGLAGTVGARPPRRVGLPSLSLGPRPARTARRAPPRAHGRDRGAYASPPWRSAGGRRRRRRSRPVRADRRRAPLRVNAPTASAAPPVTSRRRAGGLGG